MTCGVCGRADCLTCGLRLRNRLIDLPVFYERLELDAVEATPPPSERQSSGRSAPLPVPVDVLDHLILRFDNGQLDGLASLEGFCGVVIEERQFTWPHPTDTVFGRLSTACSFLNLHLVWILTQAWAGELSSEVGTMHRALRNAVEPDHRWTKTRIPCPPIYEDVCDGILWIDSLDPGNQALVCRNGCQSRWEAEAFWTLAERTSNPVSLPDAANFLGMKYADLRNWVARGKLPNHGTDGAPRVLLSELLDVHRQSLARGKVGA